MTRAGDTVARACRKLFPVLERLGVHVTPVHFYEPIPDTRTLAPSLWERESELVGVDLNAQAQLELLRWLHGLRDELAELASGGRGAGDEAARFRLENGHFDHADAYALYGIVRRFGPKKIVEVGSGFSTLVAAAALERNRQDGRPGSLVCIEPYPKPWLRDLEGVDELREQPLESLPLNDLTALSAGDVLFLDSTHVVRTGGDVVYEFLDVVPRLAPGVLVHVHDVFLPQEYPKHWLLEQRRFWTEQYLVQAFLAFNSDWEILWAGNWLRLNHHETWREALPMVPETFVPGSLWMRRRDRVG
ncbi:MAG TPA: class I SAM-dependent methyltransferase [Acidimicrobiales bacterium]|nr:class I SAM-dependent methyltransferase [Acidimicrobiales bacterium]